MPPRSNPDLPFDPRLLRLDPQDNVLCVARPIEAGDRVSIGGCSVRVEARLVHGAKLAAQVIPKGAAVLKYGQPIGTATQDIAVGELVHVHNLRSNYLPTYLHETQNAYFLNPAGPSTPAIPRPLGMPP